MPMYAYKCDSCGEVHEKLQKIGEAAPACPKCASTEQTKQLSSGTAVCLMGHGWSNPGFTGPK